MTADICTLGKAVGGGYPLGAIAGREEIMDHFDEARAGAAGYVVQVGTLVGKSGGDYRGYGHARSAPEPRHIRKVFLGWQKLMDGIDERLQERGFEAEVVGLPPLFDVVFTRGPIDDTRALARGDAGLLRRCNELLLERGILKIDIKNYMSTAHTEQDVDEALDIWSDALDVLASERQ